jgi:hypothetical protein
MYIVDVGYREPSRAPAKPQCPGSRKMNWINFSLQDDTLKSVCEYLGIPVFL